MKCNAFKVCKDVSQRVDGDVAPGGCIKAWVTPDKDSILLGSKAPTSLPSK